MTFDGQNLPAQIYLGDSNNWLTDKHSMMDGKGEARDEIKSLNEAVKDSDKGACRTWEKAKLYPILVKYGTLFTYRSL